MPHSPRPSFLVPCRGTTFHRNPSSAQRGRCCDVLPRALGTPFPSPGPPARCRASPPSRQPSWLPAARPADPQRPGARLRTPGGGAPRRRLRGPSRRVSRARRWRGRRGRSCPRSAPAAPPEATAVWAPSRRVLAWRLRVGAPRVGVGGSWLGWGRRAGEDPQREAAVVWGREKTLCGRTGSSLGWWRRGEHCGVQGEAASAAQRG